jgi:RNA polymerase sigma factor (sigma-70 family)
LVCNSLMLRVRDHDDHAAFTELLPRLIDLIDRTLRRSLPPGEIDDGRSEVTFRLWSRRKQYREDRGTVRAWTGVIARHVSVDWHRRNAARRAEAIDPGTVADRRPDPAAMAEQSDWLAHVGRRCREALDDLPSHVQAGFELRSQGLGYAEVARRVGRPVGTVASAVHRVRARLRAVVEEQRADGSSGGKAMTNRDNTDLKSVVRDVRNLEDRLARVEQVASGLADSPPARMGRLLNRLREMIDDPAQWQRDADWADVEDAIDNELAPVKERLPKGLFTKVVLRLRESRRLLRGNAQHRAAVNQMREVETLLVNAIAAAHG